MISSENWCHCKKITLVCSHKKWLVVKMTDLKQLIKLCLLRNTQSITKSTKFKTARSQDLAEVHQTNYQVVAPRNHIALPKLGHIKAPMGKYQ